MKSLEVIFNLSWLSYGFDCLLTYLQNQVIPWYWTFLIKDEWFMYINEYLARSMTQNKLSKSKDDW